MLLIGTIVNASSIVAGAMVGLAFRKGISERVKETVIQGIGLAILLVGFSMALKSENVIIVIASLAIGGTLGELLNIEGWLARVGCWIEARVSDRATTFPGPLLPLV